jgi:hypothetical protein
MKFGHIIALTGGVALVLSAAGNTNVSAQDRHHAKLVLTGCLSAGETKGTFLVKGIEVVGGADKSLAPAGASYLLDSTKGLKAKVGQKVEVTGEADLTDVDKGEIKTKTADGKTTTSLSAGDEKVKAIDSKVPATAGTKVKAETKTKVDTYRFKVSDVKALTGSCKG